MSNHIYTTDEQKKWQQGLSKKNVSSNVLVRHRQDILLVKPNYKNHWTLPGGVVDENESPEQAAIRELREETGIIADDVKFAGVSYMHGHDGFPDKLIFTFVHDVTKKPTITLQDDEIEDHDWVSTDDVLDKMGKKRAFYVNIKNKLVDGNFPFYSDLEFID